MAINTRVLKALVRVMTDGSKVASFGYPDIISDQLDGLLNGKTVEYREDSAEICRRHGIAERKIADAHSVCAAFGAELTVYDIVSERGCEKTVDLNYPMGLGQLYDVVIDPGTLEHCFNIAQAAFNMAGLLKEGGIIIHDNPFLAGNHGFYGLNPTWYADFYEQNGYELLECALYARQIGNEVHRTARFQVPQLEHHIFALAKRGSVRELTYPVQTKYKRKEVKHG